MATDITYNGVKIHGCVTREFDQELQYDQSGTDLLGVRYKIGVEGHVHCQQSVFSLGLHGIQSDDVPTAIATPLGTVRQFDRVSQLLSTPRQNFVMTWGGNTVLQCIPATPLFTSPNVCIDNGPKPRGLSVLNVTPTAIKVRWSIEFTLSGCQGESGTPLVRRPPFKIVNNRWSIAEGRDADFFTHRKITGTIRFAEGLTAKHAFIGVVMPGLEKGFKRESIEYQAEANGLECTYSVLDRQVHYSAPWPATSMEVVHANSTNDGLTYVDEIQVTLRGGPESDRLHLLQRMHQIVDARSDYLQAFDPAEKQSYATNVVITEYIGEANMVTGSYTIRRMGDGPRAVLGNILKEHLGKPLELPVLDGQPYDRSISRVPALHGYDPHGGERSPAFLFLLTCFHQDPCGTVKNIYGGSQTPDSESGSEETTTPYPTPVSTVDLSPGSQTNYSSEQLSAMYTIAKMSSRYVFNRLRVMLPLAVASDSGDTAEAADLAAGTALRIITYEAERIGAQPQIPSMADTFSSGDISGKFLKGFLESLPPSLSADGQKKIFRVLYKACYGLNKMPTNENLPVGSLPYTSFALAANQFPLGSQQSAAIGP